MYLDLGFQDLVLHAPGEDQSRFLEQFGEDVLPALRERAGPSCGRLTSGASAAAAPSRSPRSAIRAVIFDWPRSRSLKTIGTSVTRKPARTAR